MIYLVHGENLSQSRNIILNQQKKLGVPNRIELSVADTPPEQLLVSCSSFDIFGTPPFVVLDISLAGRKNLDDYIEPLKKIPPESTLIILAARNLPASSPFIKKSAELNLKVVLNERKPTSNIFKFIDSLFNANRNSTYKELQKLTIEDQDPFYMFSMILYGVRKNHRKFGEEGFKKVIKEMYDIDKAVKTGGISTEVFIPFAVEKLLEAQTNAL